MGWQIRLVAGCIPFMGGGAWAGGCIDIGAWPVRWYTSAGLAWCTVCDALLLAKDLNGEGASGFSLAEVGSGAWVPAAWVVFGGGDCIHWTVWIGQCGVIGGVGLACGVIGQCGSVWVMVCGSGPQVLVAKYVASLKR